MKGQMALRKAVLSLAAYFAVSTFIFPSADRAIRQGSVEFMLGSYNMNEPRFEAVYPSGGAIAGLTLSSAIASNFNIYLDIRYYTRQGATTVTKEKTTFYMVPIDLGVRYIYPLGFFHPYLGAGLDFYFYYEQIENWPGEGREISDTNGYHISGGAYLRFAKSVPILVNLRLKYTWAKAENKDFQIELGGLEYGLGLAFTF